MAKILIIEDDPGFRKMIDLTLTRANHVVILAKDGVEGLERFKAEKPALVISDIVMPGKQGTETILEIRAMSQDVPIVAMSGGGMNVGRQYLDAARKLGADEIILKPFRPSELVDLVSRLLLAGK
ncbi:MAG: regulator [Rhodospirillales bacterium]|nr:regulator [Rhodospirillales bacterium]